MDSLLTGLDDDQTFLLIRFPKETVDRSKSIVEGGSTKVGSLFVYNDGHAEFQDEASYKVYSLTRNSVPQTIKPESGSRPGSQKSEQGGSSIEESDLFKISLQKDEAVHLGKVKLSTLLAVPKVDEKDVSAVFG